MNIRLTLEMLLWVALVLPPSIAIAQEPPRVVKMVPENGAVNVDPKLKEIVVTFSEPMTDKSWSVTGGGDNFPGIKSIFYRKNCTELVMKVELQPGWRYEFGINSVSHKNFKSRKGVPVEPVRVTFSTKGERGAVKLKSLGKIDFTLTDANGVVVRSQDYKGVPIFIAFGAAW